MSTEREGNWVLFSYNGDWSTARLIVGATMSQIGLFIDSGGNQDDDPEWLFTDHNDCQLVQVPNDSIGLGNSTNIVGFATDGEWQIFRICDLPQWVVDTSEYPEGKIVKGKTWNQLSTELGLITESEPASELQTEVENFLNDGGLAGQPVEGEDLDEAENTPYDANGKPKDGYVDKADITGKSGF